MFFLAVLFFSKANATGLHHYFIVTKFFLLLKMLEGEHASADEWLPEFISKITGAIRCFDEDFERSLIEPFSFFEFFLPWPSHFKPGIRGHVHRSARQGQRTFAASKAITNFSAGTSRSAIKGFNCCGEIMGFCFQ